MTALLRFFVSLFILISVFGCSRSKPPAAKPEVVYVEMGDPSQIYKEAQLNPRFDLSQLVSGDLYSLQVMTVFYRLRPLETESFEEVKARATPQETVEEIHQPLLYQIVKRQGGGFGLLRTDGAEFVVSPEEGITRFVVDGQSYRSRNIHFSQTSSGSAFSLILEDRLPSEKVPFLVEVLKFVRVSAKAGIEAQPVREVYQNGLGDKSPFYFLAGPGIRSRQGPSPSISVSICGSVANRSENRAIITDAYLTWHREIQKWTNLPSQVLVPQTCKPFGDVTENNFWMISGLRISANKNLSTLGSAYQLLDPLKKNLIDLDVLVFADHFPIADDRLYHVWLHEIGHFFGLDHQMKKEIPSVMGYDEDQYRTELTDYDKKAIEVLYKD